MLYISILAFAMTVIIGFGMTERVKHADRISATIAFAFVCVFSAVVFYLDNFNN
jgi:amino acid permease